MRLLSVDRKRLLRQRLLRSSLYRATNRAYWASSLGLPRRSSAVRPGTLSALLRVKNEDYWIELILRTVCKELDDVVVVDTGSEDQTVSIVRRLQDEGLPVRLFEHRAHARHLNLIANLVVDRATSAEYFYLVDGDEIQTQRSIGRLKETVKNADPESTWRLETHYLHVQQGELLLASKPFSTEVHHTVGRVFNRRWLRLSEAHLNDGIETTRGTSPALDHTSSRFIEDAYCIHLPFTRRSTIAAWAGQSTLVPSRDWRRHYRAPESACASLPFFPKEVIECRYSGHNEILERIRDQDLPLI